LSVSDSTKRANGRGADKPHGHEIHADDAERLHLVDRVGIEQPDVQDDVGRRVSGFHLETHAEPAVALAVVLITAGADRVAEREEGRRRAAPGAEAFEQDRILVVEHRLQTPGRDISLRAAVDGVAHGHVIGGDGFRDEPGGSRGAEKPVGGFLAGSDLGEGAVHLP
jgi:hypothetical protein